MYETNPFKEGFENTFLFESSKIKTRAAVFPGVESGEMEKKEGKNEDRGVARS
jgi:hypothetical protein